MNKPTTTTVERARSRDVTGTRIGDQAYAMNVDIGWVMNAVFSGLSGDDALSAALSDADCLSLSGYNP